MVKIRLQRVGRKHEPAFRLVATDSRNSTKSGRVLELLGSYDPRARGKAIFKVERLKHWLTNGAQATPTVHNLLVDKKIVAGPKINVLGPKPPKPAELSPAEAPAIVV